MDALICPHADRMTPTFENVGTKLPFFPSPPLRLSSSILPSLSIPFHLHVIPSFSIPGTPLTSSYRDGERCKLASGLLPPE